MITLMPIANERQAQECTKYALDQPHYQSHCANRKLQYLRQYYIDAGFKHW